MIYNACSESDLESETNFQQQPATKANRMSNNGSGSYFVRQHSLKSRNNNNQKATADVTLPPTSARNIPMAGGSGRRASDCSSFRNIAGGGGGSDADDVVNYGRSFAAMKRSSVNEGGSDFRRQSNKSLQSNLSDDISTGSSNSSCSIEDSSTSSGQPNLPYPGFVEFSFKYLSQESRPRNWCLQLITNP